ncbi:NADPH--cytochrome P450 reductase [[Candida] railenensis]|uniref:NADPH--cytochrome P450 reductase n=1 Tax=[Candida] railenensis TaxID=45579 RepID=A0A9P0VZE0_9ASCO|nr:NADPH--cytochrome P450 reductase [[Candida] railenensis]
MALDTLDYAVMVALAVAVSLYFGKSTFFPSNEGLDAGFVAGAASGKTRNLVEALEKNNKKCVVFFGSQTGTAEDYASKLSKELKARFGLSSMKCDLADYDFDNFNEIPDDKLVFFLVATYGEGEPTDNAVEFFEFLENGADSNLQSLKYTVFGLGNSTYEFYNKIGKDLNNKLEELGGERFAGYGEGDDGKGSMDEDFLAWKEAVFESLKHNLNFEEHELTYEPGLQLTEDSLISKSDAGVSEGEPSSEYVKWDPSVSPEGITKGPFDHTHPYLSTISKSKELFNSKSRSCVHAEFDLSDSNLRYSTGDHLAIWPSNSNQAVSKFLSAFGLEGKEDSVFSLKSLDSTITLPFHSPITYDGAIRNHMEITGAVSRQFLQAIASFAPSEDSKIRAQKLAGDKELFAKEIHSQNLNIADALLKISDGEAWTGVPFEFLIESVAHLQPRYYSISSSSMVDKRSIHVTAVVELEQHDDRVVSGVVTNLLKNIEVSQNKKSEKQLVTYNLKGPKGKYSNYKLPVHVRRSTFKLPSNPAVPIIMIGPGTGVAPFRGFVRERCQQASNTTDNITIGKTLLFFGCRTSDEDFLYKEEWPEYSQKLGSSFELVTAFSREDPAKKVYVQHKLLTKSKEINELLEKGAYIYVCGDASKMARDVQHTLNQIISKERNLPEERGAELIRGLKVQNRYQEDVW